MGKVLDKLVDDEEERSDCGGPEGGEGVQMGQMDLESLDGDGKDGCYLPVCSRMWTMNLWCLVFFDGQHVQWISLSVVTAPTSGESLATAYPLSWLYDIHWM